MRKKLPEQESNILRSLNGLLTEPSVINKIDEIVERVEQNLNQSPNALMAWEPVPLRIYSPALPDGIRSSWVFILRAGVSTGAERHPNSVQRMMSYRGKGDLQIWDDNRWQSDLLISGSDKRLEEKWASIPINVWHQPVVPENNWVVVSFHTVPEDELIEERPDAADANLTHQRRYLGEPDVTGSWPS